MKTKNVIIGLVTATAIGGAIWYLTKGRIGGYVSSDDESKKPEDTNESETELKQPDTVDKSKNTSHTKSSSGGAVSVPPTPFKDKKSGNAFRAWVIKNHPDRANFFKLDASGDFNNQHIRKAFIELGTEYIKSLSNTTLATNLSTEKKYLDKQFNEQTMPLNIVTPKTNNSSVRKNGYINIRSSSKIIDGSLSNKIKTLKVGDSVEYITNVKGTDQLTWYKVRIKVPKSQGGSETKFGYVRSDVSDKKTIRIPKQSILA